MAIRILKWLGIFMLVIAAAIAAFLFSMRFHDGPNAIFAGGPFQTGEQTSPPADWSFLKGRPEMEFQTMDPVTSRIVWLGVLDKRLYVISGYMNTTYGKIWKQWPHYLEKDDRIILRIDGKLYDQRLERLMSHPKLGALMNIYAEKYGGAIGGPDEAQLQAALTAGEFWLFEVVDR